MGSCKVRAAHGLPAGSLGRLSKAGNVENWTTKESLDLSTVAAAGGSISELLPRAISVLRLEPRRDLAHVRCRHVRWAEQHRLLLQVAALLAFRHGPERLEVWNDEGVSGGDASEEPFGYLWRWLFARRDTEARVLVGPDGHVVVPEGGRSLWERHLAGESAEQLAAWIESELRSSRRVESTWRLARGDLADVAADVLIVPTSGGFGGEGAASQVAKRLRDRHPAVEDLSDAGVTPPIEQVRQRLDLEGSESDLVDRLALLHHSPDQRAALRSELGRRRR